MASEDFARVVPIEIVFRERDSNFGGTRSRMRQGRGDRDIDFEEFEQPDSELHTQLDFEGHSPSLYLKDILRYLK